jgi:hypothetical protein
MSLQLCSSRRGIVVGYSADCRRGFSCRDHHTIDGPELWFFVAMVSPPLGLRFVEWVICHLYLYLIYFIYEVSFVFLSWRDCCWLTLDCFWPCYQKLRLEP